MGITVVEENNLTWTLSIDSFLMHLDQSPFLHDMKLCTDKTFYINKQVPVRL